MIRSIDQLNRTIHLKGPAKRVVSLVPSITETLYDLGCEEEVIGITKFCVFPEHWFRKKTRIGGTKTFHIEKIKALNPDLIIANKEENDPQLVQQLMVDHNVWVSNVIQVKDSLDLIHSLGRLLGREIKAEQLVSKIEDVLKEFVAEGAEKKSVAYMIWQKPIMVAGGDTYIQQMLNLCDFENIFADRSRYPSLTEKELSDANPDLILLSSEPFPFKEKHLDYFQKICPNAVIKFIDGTYFSWYGSRLLQAIEYFGNLRR